jgi:AmiR/NasT family two-component response regulator
MEARVLIVEDEALIALHLEQLVIEAGHRVIGIAFDAQEAKAIISDDRPDFAFVDMHLRDGASGLNVARYLREECAVSAIFVSGNLDERNVEAAKRLRPVALVGKPFMPATVLSAIHLAVASLARSHG